MCELHEEVIARLNERHDLCEALLAFKASNSLARFGVVCHNDAGAEETWKHLAPSSPRLHILIDHRGVTGQVDRCLVDWLDANRPEARMVAVEFQSQLVIPVQVADFARLQLHSMVCIACNLRNSNIRIESLRDRGLGLHGDLLQHEPARFRPDRKSTRLNSSHLGISYAVFCL